MTKKEILSAFPSANIKNIDDAKELLKEASMQFLPHPAPDEYWYPNSAINHFKQQGYIAGYQDAIIKAQQKIEKLEGTLKLILEAGNEIDMRHLAQKGLT